MGLTDMVHHDTRCLRFDAYLLANHVHRLRHIICGANFARNGLTELRDCQIEPRCATHICQAVTLLLSRNSLRESHGVHVRATGIACELLGGLSIRGH